MAGAVGWNPWRALRARVRTRLVFASVEGARALAVVEDSVEVIYLDPSLGSIDRNACLAHELIHLERGVLPSGTPDSIVEREEHQVRGETASRLVPLEALAAFVQTRAELDPVTTLAVEEEFGVPAHVAERALAQLRHPRSAMIRERFDIEGAA